MGIIVKGILGGFRGTVGTVVGGSWKGIDYMKSLPVISATDPTPRQLEQREKFKTVVNFIRPLMEVIQLGFRFAAVEQTEYNAAFSANYKEALTGNYPNFAINFTKAVLATGSLRNVEQASVTAEPGSVIKFDWQDNSGLGNAAATDPMMLVVYCPSVAEAIYVAAAQVRSDVTGNINATQFSGKQVHTWVVAMAADGKKISKSFYTGQLTVS